MSYRLKSRQLQIPNGIFWYQPQTKWRSSPGSFNSVVNQIIAHRQANAWLKLPTGYSQVEQELDEFAAHWCMQNGWDHFVQGQGQPPPLPPPPQPVSRVSELAVGAKTLVDWIDSGAEAVAPALSDARAKICSECPANQRGDWMRFFTLPVTEAIRARLNQRSEMKLSTPYDDRIQICTICNCPLRLKVHMPIARITDKIKEETMANLPDYCWIRTEAGK